MPTVNMFEAKSTLSKLVESVESGAVPEVVIARNGKPAARLVPIESGKKGPRRMLGLAEGKYRSLSLEEFNSMDAEIERMFLGGDK